VLCRRDLGGRVLSTPTSARLAASSLGPQRAPSSPQGAAWAAGRLRPLRSNAALDRLTALAARLLGCPNAQVSLLTEVQVVASGAGPGAPSSGSASPLEESLCRVTASGGAPLVVSDAAADARVAGLPPVASGAVSAYLGVPLRTAEDITVGALCVFDSAPRTWSAYDVALLEELGGSVMAELELAALAVEYETSRVRWDTALEAAGIGGFDWDLRTDLVEWDERMQALFGYSPGEYVPQISEAFSRIHADDRPSVDAAIAEALESCGDYRAEFRVVLPEGQQRWIAARGRAVPGVDGSAAQLLGTAHDISEARTARDQAAHVLATMATGFLSVDRDWSVTYLNATGERVLGLRADELVGRTLWQAFPGLEDLEFGERYRGAMQTGEPIGFEAHYPHLDSWYEVRAVPGPEGLDVYFLDITARHADQKRAAAAAGRLELLATVSAELAKTLEVKGAVARLARLVVPALGDWCVVTLVEDDGAAQDVGWFHCEPALQPLVQHYAERRLDALTTSSFVAQARRTGQPVLVAQGATDAIGEVLTAGQARDVFVALAPESAAILPLRARGRTLGLLTVFRGKDRPRLDEEDFATAREVASRAGLALDNARLYDLQRRLAEGLQRSLLTAPPEPDHCEIVVRYAPAAQIASVRGDWFDAFLQADGATMLVIGDVVGHDTEAAAAMGQVRALLRGIAWYSGAGPAEVLSGLDAAMEGLQVDTTATAVVARLEQTDDERSRGLTRLRWSNAGHPPPMAVLPDGTVSVLSGLDADLLLGIDAGTPRVESQVALDRGATVLLYTDGLFERRGESLDEGLALLRNTLAELSGLPLRDMCDTLLARMLPGQPDDDVALVAVRLHRQDAPRPAEAGPRRVPPEVPEEP